MNQDIDELFEEDLEERNKFKSVIPEGAKENSSVFHYFDPNSNKKHMTAKRD